MLTASCAPLPPRRPCCQLHAAAALSTCRLHIHLDPGCVCGCRSVLAKGSVQEEGTHDSLAESGGLYSALVRSATSFV